MPDISKLASICGNLLIGYATSYPVPPASRQSAEWQQDSFSAWEPDLAAFSRSNRSFDYHETHALVMGQLSVLRTNLEFVASRNAEFPGRSDILSFPQEPQRLEWIQQLEGQTSEAFHAIEATISRLEQLREIIRQPPALDHESETEDRTKRDTASSDFTSIKRAAQSSSSTTSPSLQGYLAPSILERHSSLRHPTKQLQEPTHMQQTTIHGATSTPAESSRSSTEVQSDRKPKCDVYLDTPRPRSRVNSSSIASSPQGSTTTLTTDDRNDYAKLPKAEHGQPAPQGNCAKVGAVHQRVMQPDSRPSSPENPQVVAMGSRQPDLRVGIDFGPTSIGVSWSTPKEREERINMVGEWPGATGYEGKVPTVLARDGSGGKTRWGFLCKGLAEDKKWKFFHLLLDPKVHKKLLTSDECEPWVPGTTDQVHKLVTLYLHHIYAHIRNNIPKLIKANPTFSPQLRVKTWDSLEIDFIFSTPTTWQAPVSQCFRGIVSKAGFGYQKLHRVVMGLTEAEAAAVFTCLPGTVDKVQKDDVLLLILAGGRTTDLAFVEATADTTNSIGLKGVYPVAGIGVGSRRIDSEFAKLIEERVKQHSETQQELPKDFSLKVSQSQDFQTWKHQLGPKDRAPSGGEYRIRRVTGKDSYSHEGLGIREDSLYFTRRQLERCFDVPLDEIRGFIKESLDNFEAYNRRKRIVRRVNYVVLSGGLGRSDYVLKELTTFFNGLASEANSCVTGSKVFRAKCDARTVVMKGLLYDRRTKARALREHIARSNYGIIVEKPRPEDSSPRKNTKQYPVDTTIRWLVKFGETIPVDRPIIVDISKRLEKSDQGKWTEKIVWLKGESSYLPTNVEEGWTRGMKELHNVDIEVPQTQPRWGWSKTPSRNCDFKLMLFVGPSGDCVVEVSENVIKRSG